MNLNHISGLKIHNKTEPSSHQQFIDDTLLIGHPLAKENKTLKKILDKFKPTSGMEINAIKSQIFFFSTPQSIQTYISRTLQIQKISLPSKYLGALLLERFLKLSSWEYFLIQFEHKLSCWTFRALNFPVHLILLK